MKIQEIQPISHNHDLPLRIHLDGVLVRTNILFETVLTLLKGNFFYVFLLPIWFLQGREYFRLNVAKRVELDPNTLIYDLDAVERLRLASEGGRTVVLTGSVADRHLYLIREHLGLARPSQSFHGGGTGMTVEPFDGLILKAGEQTTLRSVRNSSGSALSPSIQARAATYLRAMRLHQWLKNILVFVPLVLAHRVLDLAAIFDAAIAFGAFCLCASAIYVLNDLLDLAADRQHPTKRHRPFAAGQIPVVHGAFMIPVLLTTAFTVALLLPFPFVLLICTYVFTNVFYCFYLKRLILFDVLTLAGLYTLRIIAGSVAIREPMSFWLLAFSIFLFASLALVKRYVEVKSLGDSVGRKGMGRGYRAVDLETLSQFGITSAFSSVLVLALYIHSNEVQQQYGRPEVIWFLCPILLYVICRIWLLARRDELHEDPVVFAARDRRSQGMVAFGLFLLLVAA